MKIKSCGTQKISTKTYVENFHYVVVLLGEFK